MQDTVGRRRGGVGVAGPTLTSTVTDILALLQWSVYCLGNCAETGVNRWGLEQAGGVLYMTRGGHVYKQT